MPQATTASQAQGVLFDEDSLRPLPPDRIPLRSFDMVGLDALRHMLGGESERPVDAVADDTRRNGRLDLPYAKPELRDRVPIVESEDGDAGHGGLLGSRGCSDRNSAGR